MNHFAQRLAAITISIGLGLISLNASAVVAVPTGSLIFNAQGIATFSSATSAGATTFNNLFTFSTTSASSGGASSVASFNGTGFSAAFTTFNLLNVSNGNSVVATGVIGPSFVTQLGFTGLTSNTTYGLNVAGTVTNPSLGSFYTGSLTVSPVPEPSEYLLLGIGLALLGFIAYRRKHSLGFELA